MENTFYRPLWFENASIWSLCVLTMLLFALIFWPKRKQYLLSWQLPGPIAFPFLGNSYIVLQGGVSNAMMHLNTFITKYGASGGLVRFWNGSELTVLVGDATVAKQINRKANKPDFYNFFGGDYLNKGLFPDTDILHWKWARKICQPFFGFKSVKSLIWTFHAESLNVADQFKKFALTGESCMPSRLTFRYSFYSSMKTLFDENHIRNEEECDIVYDLMAEIMQIRVVVSALRSRLISWLSGLPQQEEMTTEKYLGILERTMNESKLRYSYTNGTPTITGKGRTFLRRMMESNEFSEVELLNQLATIAIGGVDTTKTQNMAFLLMMALHPQVQQRLHKEISEVLGDDVTVVPTYEDVMKLEYLDRVLQEGMRILPAAPIIAKKADQEMRVTTDDGSYTIPAGTIMTILIYSIHNSPKYYENPQKFDPDRWLPERVAQRHPHRFLAFSDGPRKCIGEKYALLQMKMFAVTMIRMYEILPSESCKTMEDVKFQMDTALKFRDNCRIKIRQRNI